VLHSSYEPDELSQWLSNDDNVHKQCRLVSPQVSIQRNARKGRNVRADTAYILAFWPLRRLRQLRGKVCRSLALRALRWMETIGITTAFSSALTAGILRVWGLPSTTHNALLPLPLISGRLPLRDEIAKMVLSF